MPSLFEPVSSRRELGAQLSWGVLWLVTTGFALFLRPDPHGHGTHQQLGLPACPSVLIFNRPCPGCGLTTSFSATVHGNLGLAWEAHPFGSLFYLLLTLSGLACLYGVAQGLRFRTDTKLVNRGVLALAFGFAVFGLVRMAFVHPYRTPTESLMAR